jgi:hypothetical protein
MAQIIRLLWSFEGRLRSCSEAELAPDEGGLAISVDAGQTKNGLRVWLSWRFSANPN